MQLACLILGFSIVAHVLLLKTINSSILTTLVVQTSNYIKEILPWIELIEEQKCIAIQFSPLSSSIITKILLHLYQYIFYLSTSIQITPLYSIVQMNNILRHNLWQIISWPYWNKHCLLSTNYRLQFLDLVKQLNLLGNYIVTCNILWK